MGLPVFVDYETPLNAANMNALRNAIIVLGQNMSSLRSTVTGLQKAVVNRLPLDGSQAMQGDLDMGVHSITNASIVEAGHGYFTNISTTTADGDWISLGAYLSNLSSRITDEASNLSSYIHDVDVKSRSIAIFIRAPIYLDGDYILGGGTTGSHYKFDENVRLRNIKVTVVARDDPNIEHTLAFSILDSSGVFFNHSQSFTAGEATLISESLGDRNVTTGDGISIRLDRIRGIKHATFVLNYY